MELEEGQLLGGRFRLGARLGRSEIGEAYAALDQEQSRECALKVLVPAVARAAEAWDAFQRISRAASALGLESLSQASDFGVDTNLERPFFTSELLAFPSLLEVVHRQGAVPVDFWARTLASLGRVFAALQRAGIVHGDLKPQNLFLSPQSPGTVRVADLGMIVLRRACPPAHGPGSLGFCPLEELGGQAAPSPRGDVYALALVSFYALTARHYCPGMWEAIPDASRVRQELVQGPASASLHAASLGGTLPKELDDWFARALDPDPAGRFETVLGAATAFALATGLGAALPGTSDFAVSPTIPAPPPDSHRAAAPAGPTPTLDTTSAESALTVPATIVDESLSRIPRPPPRKHIALAAAGASLVLGATVWGALRSSSSEVVRPSTPAASKASSATRAASVPEAPAPVLPPPPTKETHSEQAATRVLFACRPVDCEFIVCDGRNIPKGVREAAVVPGRHHCNGSRYGYRSATVDVDVQKGTTTDVVFELVPTNAVKQKSAALPGKTTSAKKTSAKSSPAQTKATTVKGSSAAPISKDRKVSAKAGTGRKTAKSGTERAK